MNTVACRDYFHPREEKALQPKGWIQGNTKIGRQPVICMVNMELRSELCL